MSDKTKLQVESWPIEKVIPYEKNAKKHPPEQIEKLARVIRDQGWDQPIVVDKDGMIIKGHGRRLAALKNEMKFVPVIVRRDLTPDQVIAARLSDNQVSSTLYDTALIQEELAALNLSGFDITALGFEDRDLEFLTADLMTMDEGALVDDIEQAVGDQQDQNDAALAAVDGREVPLAKAFGFKAVPGDKEHVVVRFMAQLETESGLKGADALVDFIEKLNEAA